MAVVRESRDRVDGAFDRQVEADGECRDGSSPGWLRILV